MGLLPLSTLTVGAAVAPTVFETSILHYLNRKPLRQKPTAHISYDVGLNLIRQFLTFASHHTVEEVQSFTGQWVPTPRWVRDEEIAIPEGHVAAAADHITRQLGPAGVRAVGGREWWRWRREGRPLKADWIEMRKDYNARARRGAACRRSMLYVHGGAYYFGSVDEHRYQIQRHARKLGARVLAPRYRLAPSFPFPCGLLDCVATYLHMLTTQPPETIILAGDSAGGGMVVAMLVILRDQGIPLPAGAVLLSPWVDLTHSFPSVAGDNALDYVPAHGFIHRPSMAWPPPSADDVELLSRARARGLGAEEAAREAVREAPAGVESLDVEPPSGAGGGGGGGGPRGRTGASGEIEPSGNLSITLDGERVEITDQIQIYATNTLISHPLVSPVLQASLGGLPPLCVLVGGGEMLRDEQIYLAHKAAAPAEYAPSAAALASQGLSADAVTRHPPTDVQLQVWDDMCHVAPTLSFTRPAKHMYRAAAQFGAWALSRAQDRPNGVGEDDALSVISTSTSSGDEEEEKEGGGRRREEREKEQQQKRSGGSVGIDVPAAAAAAAAVATAERTPRFVGRAGDDLPDFVAHMIRERVDRHGEIFPLDPPSALPACGMAAEEVGTIKPGPVRKWIAAQQEWCRRYAKDKRRVRERRLVELAAGGYEAFEGEVPPPTALAGRRMKGYQPKPHKKRRSNGLAIWSGWGSKHDEEVIQQAEDKRQNEDGKQKPEKAQQQQQQQQQETADREQPLGQEQEQRADAQATADPIALVSSSGHPVVDDLTVPFKLARPDPVRNLSTLTLTEEAQVSPMSATTRGAAGESSPAAATTALFAHGDNATSTAPDVPTNNPEGSSTSGGRPTFDRFVTAAEEVSKI